MRQTLCMAVVLCLLGMSTAFAVPFTIDDFTEPVGDQSVSFTGAGTASDTVTGLTPANTVGGSRQLDLTVASGSQSNSLVVDHDDYGVGALSMNLGSGTDGFGVVTWDSNGAGLSGVDLTVAGTNPYLQASIRFSDQDLGFAVTITETAAAGGSTASWSTNLGPGVSYVNQALSSFTNAGDVDFTDVDKIVLTLSGPLAQDATIDLLEVTNTPQNGDGNIPEPAGLLGLGLLGLVRRRRRS